MEIHKRQKKTTRYKTEDKRHKRHDDDYELDDDVDETAKTQETKCIHMKKQTLEITDTWDNRDTLKTTETHLRQQRHNWNNRDTWSNRDTIEISETQLWQQRCN